MPFLVVEALRVELPLSKAVNRLRASLLGTLLKRIRVGATIAVVSNVSRDLVDPAAPVLVRILVMEAVVVLSPSTITVNGLATLHSRAFDLAVLVRALLAALR